MITWTGPTAPDAACPSCSGPRTYNVVFRHSVECPLLAALDATQARDAEMRGLRIRPATSAELTLCAALGATLTAPVSALIYSHPPVWVRRFTDASGGFDPDLKETP